MISELDLWRQNFSESGANKGELKLQKDGRKTIQDWESTGHQRSPDSIAQSQQLLDVAKTKTQNNQDSQTAVLCSPKCSRDPLGSNLEEQPLDNFPNDNKFRNIMGTVRRKVNTENATQMSVLNYSTKWAIKLLSASWRKWLKRNFNITWFLPFFSRITVFFSLIWTCHNSRLHVWKSLSSPTMVILIPCFLTLKMCLDSHHFLLVWWGNAYLSHWPSILRGWKH